MMPMRKLLLVCLTVLSPVLFSSMASAEGKSKVVYHVSDMEKVPFALRNIQNHIKGVGGPDNVEIILVAHGPAVKAFHSDKVEPSVVDMVEGLQTSGVAFNMCGNTLNAQKKEIDDLLPDFVRVDQGGVVRLAELQAEGYLYIRP